MFKARSIISGAVLAACMGSTALADTQLKVSLSDLQSGNPANSLVSDYGYLPLTDEEMAEYDGYRNFVSRHPYWTTLITVGLAGLGYGLYALADVGSEEEIPSANDVPSTDERSSTAAAYSNPTMGVSAANETPEYAVNTGNAALKASSAYAEGYTGKGFIVGLLDAGIDRKKMGAEFAGRVPLQRDYTGDEDKSPFINHGAMVSSLIAGRKNNQNGHGIAYNSTIYDYRVVKSDGRVAHPTTRGLAIRHAKDDGVHSINYSLGADNLFGAASSIPSSTWNAYGEIANAVAGLRSTNSYRGSVIFMSTGNDGDDQPNIEALLPFHYASMRNNVVAVTALSRYNPATPNTAQLANFANKCGDAKDWCMAAPGQGIAVSTESGETRVVSGTSIATPFVNGAFLLIWEAYPHLKAEDVREILFATATDIGAPGVDEVFGHGVPNLQRAMQPIGNVRTSSGANSYSQGSDMGSYSTTGGNAGLSMAAMPVTMYDQYSRAYSFEIEAVSKQPTATYLAPDMPMGFSAKLTEDAYGLSNRFALSNDVSFYWIGEIQKGQLFGSRGSGFFNTSGDTYAITQGVSYRTTLMEGVSLAADITTAAFDYSAKSDFDYVQNMTGLAAGGAVSLSYSNNGTHASVAAGVPMQVVSAQADLRHTSPFGRVVEENHQLGFQGDAFASVSLDQDFGEYGFGFNAAANQNRHEVGFSARLSF